MFHKVVTGLDVLINDQKLHDTIKGNVGYLCHSASISSKIEIGIVALKKIFGNRLQKVFSPQHGLVSDVQDNMVESDHFQHPYFGLPVYSLYSETRKPTAAMLAGLQHIIVDLQDVGTRIYTYIYSLTLVMEACADQDIEVIVLDRPNPIDGETLEGNILDLNFSSFVGRHPLPVRHGLTIGEVALMAKKWWSIDCKLRVVNMVGWKRNMSFEDTQLPWVMPSPNLPTVTAAYTFVGTVLYEGTNISEGRGTTRSLEFLGHPAIEPYSFLSKLNEKFKQGNQDGFVLRPVVFQPTFQKHAGKSCGGYQIHVIDRKKFNPWTVCQMLLAAFYEELGADFKWKEPPYEYEYKLMPIDLINGTDKLRFWVENNGNLDELQEIASEGFDDYLEKRKEILLY